MFGEGKTLVYFCKLARASENLSGVAAEMLQAETHCGRAEARGPAILFSFLMKLSATPDSPEAHACA